MEGLKSHIVVTRLGDYWVTQDQARTIAKTLGTAKFITLEGSMISTYSIDGILTPEQYKDNARQRSKHWKCQHGNIHGATEFCRCGHALASPTPRVELDISDEQKAINAARARATSEYIRERLGSGKKHELKDSAKREAYVERRAAEILATAAPDDAGSPAESNTAENPPHKKERRKAPQNATK